MSESTKSASGGIGVTGLLGVAFIILKLCHVIDWSWWWVTCPFWAPFVIVFGVLTIMAFTFLVIQLLPKKK